MFVLLTRDYFVDRILSLLLEKLPFAVLNKASTGLKIRSRFDFLIQQTLHIFLHSPCGFLLVLYN